MNNDSEILPVLQVLSNLEELLMIVPNDELDCLDVYRWREKTLINQNNLFIKENLDTKPASNSSITFSDACLANSMQRQLLASCFSRGGLSIHHRSSRKWK